MIVKQHIKDFDKLGLGNFIQFGACSVLGKGEWEKWAHNIRGRNK